MTAPKKPVPPTPEIDLSEFRRMSGCSLLKADMTEEQRLKVDAALAEPDISHAAIREVLLSWGLVISKETISGHRASPQRCACRTTK